jgi:putative membrane protein
MRGMTRTPALSACTAVACLAAAPLARAHVPDLPAGSTEVPWTFEPWVVCLLLLGSALYAAGLRNLWRRAGMHRGVSVWQTAAFAGGQLAIIAALVSPLDALGTLLFSAHMVQHEILMVVAAPLLVIGRPLAVWTWGLPPRWRSGAGNATRLTPIAVAWRVLTHPAVAWALHGLVLWAWHMPSLFEAALARPGVHTLQHTSFFASALLFWWAPLGSASRPGQGASMFYLFTTMVHTAALGALLTLSPALWYPAYASTSLAFELDPLEDQQLGGLVMWVPAGMAYLTVGLALAARWLRDGGTARTSTGATSAPSRRQRSEGRRR